MSSNKGACLVCGKPLQYFDKPMLMECEYCHNSFESYAACEDGHFICDNCHTEKGVNAIIELCLKSSSKNPVELIQKIMNSPYIYMHGPEHHIIVGAALLTAYKNAGGDIDLKDTLDEMKSRGSKYPGGSCGYWGCCGAAVSTGMFFSIITKTTPLSSLSWGQGNLITSNALKAIGEIGGPRCCKRNSFTAIISAVEFVKEYLNIEMELPKNIRCGYSAQNKQCLGKRCPYNKESINPIKD